jgi:glycosyltransferase involved in cell wall biosynthesis
MNAHILFLSSAHPPEDKRVFAKEAVSLAEAGYRVTHLCPRPGDGPHAGERQGVGIETFAKPRGILGRALAIPALAARAHRRRADAIHCNEVDSWIAGLLVKLLGLGRPRIVFDVHEHYSSTFAESRFPPALRPAVAGTLKLLFRCLAPFTDRIVFANPAIASDHPGAGVRGVLVQNFAPLRARPTGTPARHGAPTMIHVGLMSRLRGWPQLLAVMTRLETPWRLRVIGTFNDGSEADFHATAARLGLAGRVRHDPWMAFDDMLVACAEADIGLVLFQPGTRNHVLAWPHKLFDYWLAGLPVIVPDFAEQAARLVREVSGGLAIDPSDPAAIAAAIDAMDESSRRRMGEAGQAAVLTNYNWEQEAARLLAMYSALLPASRAAPGRVPA